MTIDVSLKRSKIYEYAQNLQNTFADDNLILPIKISYAINKNKILFANYAQEVEFYRNKVIKKYGSQDEENSNMYFFESQEEQNKAAKEFDAFMDEEERVKIYIVDLNDIPEDAQITTKQIEAIMFMIAEAKEESI